MPEILAQMPLLIGSTAKIMKELYRMSMDYKGPLDTAFNRCVTLDSRTMQARNQLDTSSQFSQTVDDIGANIGNIDKSLPTVNREQQALLRQQKPLFEEKYKKLKVDMQTLDQQFETLTKQYRQLVFEQREKVKHLLHEQREKIADLIIQKPKGTFSKNEVDRLLSSLEKDVTQFSSSVDQYKKEQKALSNNLNSLYLETNNALPATYRAETAAIEATTHLEKR